MKKEYVEGLLWRGLNEIIRHDAIKENDGIRMFRHWKADLPDFYENNHPKYLIYAHRLLINVAGATSPRLREQLIWNRTVNVEGGARKNIPKDLHCEHLNRQNKENCRDAGGQLTQATIDRHSQMLGVGKMIKKVYQEQVVESHIKFKRHNTPDTDADVRHLTKTLQPLHLFNFQAGRSFNGFENSKTSKGVTFPRKFKERLIRHTNKIADRRELTADD
ncbi:unnamed protein product [Mytilus coruscus]|uniref:DUF6589 domain-containing protein n=1 Tax=Mytilus coruscus TaxID=42192 RepID=A0A6J8CPC8_MYTCO|nr:unnamed protein product [Mytilus coruscus]